MSKIGNVAMELDQKATELGFESLQQALDAGCVVEYGSDGNSELVEPLMASHRAWLKEKEDLVKSLEIIHQHFDKPTGISNWAQTELEHAIRFIEEAHE